MRLASLSMTVKSWWLIRFARVSWPIRLWYHRLETWIIFGRMTREQLYYRTHRWPQYHFWIYNPPTALFATAVFARGMQKPFVIAGNKEYPYCGVTCD